MPWSSSDTGRVIGSASSSCPLTWSVRPKRKPTPAEAPERLASGPSAPMDDAYLGGVRSGGKRGRGSAGKTPFVAAVSTSPEGRPRKL